MLTFIEVFFFDFRKLRDSVSCTQLTVYGRKCILLGYIGVIGVEMIFLSFRMLQEKRKMHYQPNWHHTLFYTYFYS